MTLQRKTSVATPSQASGVATPDRARSWLLAALTALVVARPLLPSEGVSWLGDGQPFNMLAILIAAACSLWAIAQGGFVRRFNNVDAAIGALVALCIAAALFGAQNGSPRPAINMLFEWFAMGLVFFLTRQLVRTALETRAVVAVMVALAVVMAGIGFYQVYVSLPADRAAYAEDPDRVLRESGQWYPPGSPARVQFENRLQSSEPTATFALANSLAGFLAPWLVMGVGIALGQFDRRRGGFSRGFGQSAGALARPLVFALCLVAVGGCLVLTKSRSAYVALAVGAALFPLLDRGVRRRVLNARFAWAAGAIVLLVIGGAIATGGLDIQVLTETNKSLGYRLEYWRSTLAMIGRHPWLGVGPGNFQDYYTQFKLPQASEEIRDPHNFLLEVWATAGTFAVVALCQALGALALRNWRMNDSADEPAGEPSSSKRPAERSTIATAPNGAPRNAAFIAAGAGLGFLLAFVVGPMVGLSFSDGQLVGGLAAGAAVLGLVWPWIVRGTLPARLPALAVLVLLIHWLGAGSIAYPGVAYSFWMLLALGLNQTEGELSVATADPARRRVPWAPVAGLVVTGGAALACYLLAYGPVLHSQVVMSRLEEVHKNTDARVNLLLDAVAADPLSSEPWSAVAQIELARLKQNPDNPESMKRFVTATNHMVELRPHSSTAWRQIGRWYSEFHEANHHALTAKLAANFFAHAVELYPNLASLRAEYALALQQNGESALARRQIEMARQLDEQTPHADKKLSSELRRQLDELDSPAALTASLAGAYNRVSGRVCLDVVRRAFRSLRTDLLAMKVSYVVIVAVVLGSMLGVAITWANFHESPPLTHGTTAAGPVEAAVHGRPKVLVDAPFHDFGPVERDSKVEHIFHVTNMGDAPLTLKAAGTTCTRCTIAELSKSELLPGETGEVKVEYTATNTQPRFRQHASIRTNDPDQPVVDLTISGLVKSRFRILPDYLVLSRFSSTEGKTAEIKVFAFVAKEISLEKFEFLIPETASLFTATSEPIPGDQLTDRDALCGLRVLVTAKPGLPLGPIRQTIRLELKMGDRGENTVVEVAIEGTVDSDISIVGKGWNAEYARLRIGEVKSSVGATRDLLLVIRGPHRHDVKITPAVIEPSWIKVKLGEPTELKTGADSQRGVTQIPLTVEIPPGLPPVNHLGSTEDGKYAEVILETTHPDVEKIRMFLQFVIVQ